jgi:two-component system, cell cycle sensor histidine kinase and response regulator CckA
MEISQLYQSIFHLIPDCLVVVDKELRIVLCNWAGGFDQVPEELRRKGLHCYDAFYPEHKGPCDPCHVREVFRTGRPVTVEKLHPKVGPLEIRCFPLFDEEGQVALVAEQMVNVTQARQLAKQLAESEARFHNLMDLLPQTVFETDRDGTITFANPAGFAALGYTMDDLDGDLNVLQMVVPEERNRAKDNLQRVFGGVCARGHEYTILRRDGRTFPAMVFVDPVFHNGEVTGAVGILVDISEPKKLEEQLFQSQKMEVVARMGSGLAHDFNNLLVIVQGYSELLLDRLEDDSLRELVENILTAGECAATLTGQLLALSRGQRGRPEELDLGAVVTGLDSLIRPLLNRHIVLSVDSDSALGPVKADRGQIEQVITNLVINAKDAMAEGGRLTIEIRNVDFATADPPCPAGLEPGPYVLLAVSDTGSGMDAATLSHIFEPFFTTKELGKGTGLGLPTVYSIVQNHGGHIEVFSAPGEGTTFSIYLPRMPA